MQIKKVFYSLIIFSLLPLITMALDQQLIGASLKLDPNSAALNVGDNLQVKILLDTGGLETDGAEVFYLHYPQDILEVIDADAAKSGVQILAGSLYPNTLSNIVLPSKGTIDFSQVTAGGQKFKGSGVLATVNFKAKKSGKAELYFDFKKDATTDSNVVSLGADALAFVNVADLIIKNSNNSNELPPAGEIVVPPQNNVPPVVTTTPASNSFLSGKSKFIALGFFALFLSVLLIIKKKRSR